MSSANRYRVDEADPRAPAQALWDQMTPEERRAVVDALPSELDFGPPEGDPHRIPKQRGLEALDAFFRRIGRSVYLSSELPVYYPDERVFAPDLIAVLDVDPGERMRWVVSDEGKGLDFALEVTLAGSRKKDLEDNVARFARLGIPEYFVFDRRARRLSGFRLGGRPHAYDPIVPQAGRWASKVLGLELAVEGDRFRFFFGSAVLPEAAELLDRANRLGFELQSKLDELEQQLEAEEQRAEQEKQRAEQEKQRAEQEKQRADEAEARAARLETELRALRRTER